MSPHSTTEQNEDRDEFVGDTDQPDDQSPADTTLDAALELEEIIQGHRIDAPAFVELVAALKQPKAALSGQATVSMLTDVRSIGLVRNAIKPLKEFAHTDVSPGAGNISVYLDLFVEAIEKNKIDLIREAKKFCLALNKQFLAKGYDELMSRQKHSKSVRPSHGR